MHPLQTATFRKSLETQTNSDGVLAAAFFTVPITAAGPLLLATTQTTKTTFATS
jgi:hypothetical protein